MRLQPSSLEAVQALVTEHPRIRIRAGGTKTALSGAVDGTPVLDLSGLSGVVEHTPEECTFTALAGTPVAEIDRMLAVHGQYLPFDPPLAAAGATLGGTAAAGLNGSCRLRYGGIRDFVIGARIVDGHGRLVRSGGKVVKNAAGFLLHQALVGSCGRLGILAELTLKVFPAPEAHTTIRIETPDLPSALRLMADVQSAHVDFEAIDLEPPSTLWLRIGGCAEALPARVSGVLAATGGRGDVIGGHDEAAVWRRAREYAWVPVGYSLVRVPITRPVLPRFDAALEWYETTRRYSVAGNLALVACTGALDAIADVLRGFGLTGQVLLGPAERPFIGSITANAFEDRVRSVMDPDGRFL